MEAIHLQSCQRQKHLRAYLRKSPCRTDSYNGSELFQKKKKTTTSNSFKKFSVILCKDWTLPFLYVFPSTILQYITEKAYYQMVSREKNTNQQTLLTELTACYSIIAWPNESKSSTSNKTPASWTQLWKERAIWFTAWV